MSWCNPVGEGEKSCHELRTDDEPREEIVQPYEHAAQNLRRRHLWNKAHECLAKVGVDSEVECKETLKVTEMTTREFDGVSKTRTRKSTENKKKHSKRKNKAIIQYYLPRT